MPKTKRAAAKVYEIKPLKWVGNDTNGYRAFPLTGLLISVWSSPFSEGKWVCSHHKTLCDTSEQCKELAYRWYKKYLLKALKPAKAGKGKR